MAQMLRGSDAPKDHPPGVQTPIAVTTLLYTIFTKAGGPAVQVYSASTWVNVRMRLDNAGPVAVGTKPELVPVLSGAGLLLPVGEWVKFSLFKGTKLYVAAESVNRIETVIEPVPWQEQVVLQGQQIIQLVAKQASTMSSFVSSVVSLARGRK